MKIANVIFEKELVNHTRVNYINYCNEFKAYDEFNEKLPTLYVGWNFMKSCNANNNIIQNADILKKEIVFNELYWEFSFQENKASHVKGVDMFVELAPQYYFSPKFRYINLDPVFYQFRKLDDLLNTIPKNITKAYNLKNEMLYLLREDKIWGINLAMYSFFKFNIPSLIHEIKYRTFYYQEDLDGNIYQSYYKIFPNFELLKRYLVAIVSK